MRFFFFLAWGISYAYGPGTKKREEKEEYGRNLWMQLHAFFPEIQAFLELSLQFLPILIAKLLSVVTFRIFFVYFQGDKY